MLTKYIKLLSLRGLHLPFAYNPVTHRPSVTLLAFYILMLLTVTSLVYIHFFPDYYIATGMTLLAWIASYVFYKLRALDSFKINVKEGSLELDSDNTDKEEE